MRSFLLVLCFLLSGSCFAQWNDFFSTRLNPRLAISGVKCLGGERSEVSDRICEEGQWLVSLDRENTCDEVGCTKFYAASFIAKLKMVNIITPTTIKFYEIIPRDFVTHDQRRILGRYWVKFDLNGSPEVIYRDYPFLE